METDPLAGEERERFDSLVEHVEEELNAQIGVHRLESENGVHKTALLIADVLWDRWELRPRQ
jgi:hypothetical protein